MPVSSAPFAVRFVLRFPQGQASLREVQLCGSIKALGDCDPKRAVQMSWRDNEWSYTIESNSIVSYIQYRYILCYKSGEIVSDITRILELPSDRRIHWASKNPSHVLIEAASQFGRSDTSIKVFVPSSDCMTTTPCASLDELQKLHGIIESLQTENARLKQLELDKNDHLSDLAQEKFRRNQEILNLMTEINNLRGKVKVIARFRPLLAHESHSVDYQISHSGTVVTISDPYTRTKDLKEFSYDEVYDGSHSNWDVYKQSKLDQLISSSVMLQSNLCVFCYGQTGSGKSFTMVGERGGCGGMIGFAIATVFDTISGLGESSLIDAEIIEIYRDHVFSLVDRTYITSQEELLDLYDNSAHSRATASTKMNAASSRSHLICVLTVTNNHKKSEMYFVDLAGSERTKISQSEGDRLAEANYINKSLSSLGTVLNGLLNKKSFIPYRDSKLTKFLAPVLAPTVLDSANGIAGSSPQSSPVENKVIMIANLSPSVADYRETISTLNFASRVGLIELKHFKPNGDLEREVLEKESKLEQLIGENILNTNRN